ncbi:hypothetical protein [Prauserella muralis]|nr:hypothetical protein [Prauserella muralis]
MSPTLVQLWRPRGTASFNRGTTPVDLPGRVTVFRPGRDRRRPLGRVDHNARPGTFVAPHAIAVDSVGDVYVAEVTGTFGVQAGRVPASLGDHQLQKFVRTT